MKNTKTFRLFISSTFNDFRREREVLQTKVFPKVKEYCSKKGYTFQPIDLRWGISEEAQLDQKTLALCLDEVRSCKSYPYPNFLVMLGDRYGWVPLPYAIEKKEFEDIQGKVKESDTTLTIEYKQHKVHDEPNDIEKFHYEKKKARTTSKLELLQQWYTLDENQIPASYILNERDPQSDYKVYENWEAEENKLRDILHVGISDLNLTEKEKRKYFISATEAEIEEGIIPYIGATEHQKNLIEEEFKKEKLDLYKVDSQHILVFLRKVESNIKDSDMFIGDDQEKALSLQDRVSEVLPRSNVFIKTTKQVSVEKLDESYLREFEQRIFNFLKEKVDEQLKNEDSSTELEVENEAQKFFAGKKRQNFLGQAKILNQIQEYVENNDCQPLILYGASGKGKSALIAHAIENASANISSRQVFYRFIGATPYSSSSKEILISLFSELGKDVRPEDEKYKIFFHENENIETFEMFSERIYNEILQIKKDIVIFIDAVDQLTHLDNFMWLPSCLPKNVKIIISALKDEKYSDASQYYIELSKKTDNCIEIDDFEKPLELLNKLLKKEKRQIQEDQEKYFLIEYNKVKSPLYVTVAAEEMKHWKSYDVVSKQTTTVRVCQRKLSDSQKGIIEEFIENLSSFYHHDQEFVKKVLGYLYASGDGLSENELLELISVDKDFVKRIAPDRWHENVLKELPTVIWTRLYYQLKPFLSSKNEDKEELLYFFHREFEDVVLGSEPSEKQQNINIGYLSSLVDYIRHHDGKSYMYNRLSSLYLSAITKYEMLYNDRTTVEEYSNKLLEEVNKDYLKYLLTYINTMTVQAKLDLDMNMLQIYTNNFYRLSKKLYENVPEVWRIDYIRSLNLLSFFKKITTNEGLSELQLALRIAEEYKNDNAYIHDYINIIISISDYYNFVRNEPKKSLIELEKAINIYLDNLDYFEENDSNNKLYNNVSNRFSISAIMAYDITGDPTKLEIALDLCESDVKEIEKNSLLEDVSKYWNNLGEVYRRIAYRKEGKEKNSYFKKALNAYKESLLFRYKAYKKNRLIHRDGYVNILKNASNMHLVLKEYDDAVSKLNEAKNICHESYIKNPKLIADLYSDILNNLGDTYSSAGCFLLACHVLEDALKISQKYNLQDSYKVSQNLTLAKQMLNLNIPCEINIGRNDLCSCGSGKKYKKCCGKN